VRAGATVAEAVDRIFEAYRSRYKDTARFDGPRGPRLALCEFPVELNGIPRNQYRVHALSAGEEGFLDALSVTYYGAGSEDLWWVIAYANGLIDVEMETYNGQFLRVPPAGVVTAMLQRRGKGV
jgi:hypothetical protein